jgi:DNA-binding FadR family transcriptional regulator
MRSVRCAKRAKRALIAVVSDDWMTAVTKVPKLHEAVLAEVLADVVRGTHAEGAMLPKEQALAEAHGVSRYVARQAIQALRDRGLITVTHGVGAFVSPRRRWNLFDPVLLEAMLDGPDASDARSEASEAAALVWPEVAALAAKRRTAAQLRQLEGASGPEEIRDQLVTCSRNRFLAQVVSTLDGHQMPAVTPARGEDYARVIAAVRDRDGEAARTAMVAAIRGGAGRSRKKKR